MRRVLRDWYVGAVLLGLVLYNFVGALVKIVENPVLLWIQRSVQHSALSAGQPWYNKTALLAELVDALIFLAIAVLLGSWIYRPDPTVAPAVETKASA
jgi:hypothetical protein